MANPFPFVAGEILTAADMNGIGELTSYTPTWGGLTVGNGVQSWKYVRVNNFVYVTGLITLGSTSSVAANISVNVPINSTNQPEASFVGQTALSDASTTAGAIATTIFASNRLFAQPVNTAGTYAANVAVSATVPWTWAVNDTISITGIYTI
jgi:hypothetical protein